MARLADGQVPAVVVPVCGAIHESLSVSMLCRIGISSRFGAV
jgi:hypothetical protein